MGSAKLVLTSLELNRAEDLTIKLEDAQRANKDLGEIKLGVTLWPKTQEDKEQVRFDRTHMLLILSCDMFHSSTLFPLFLTHSAPMHCNDMVVKNYTFL